MLLRDRLLYSRCSLGNCLL